MRQRRLSARTYLLGLIAVAIIPVWLFAAYLVVSYALTQRDAYRERAIDFARQSALAVDGELREMLSRLDGLARSVDPERPDFPKLHADARRLAAGTGQVVLLRDLSETERFNTQFPFGTPLPPARPLSQAERADLEAGRPRISDVVLEDGGPKVAVSWPLRIADEMHILEMVVPAVQLHDVLRTSVAEGWVVGVGDRAGVYVTRSQRHDEVAGRPGLPEYIAKATGKSGSFTSPNQFGQTLLAGYVWSDVSGWLYAANIDLATVEAPLWRSIYGILATAAIALIASIALAYLVGRRLTGETNKLVGAALALGSRRPVDPVDSRLSEFALVGDALVRAEAMLHERTQELEAVVATAPVAVWFTYDPSAREVIRNRYAAELMGLSGDDSHVNRPDQVIATVAYRDGALVERDQRPLSRAMRGEHTDSEEYSYVLLNGEIRNLITSARPILHYSGRIVGAVQVSMDITTRKRGEEQLQLLARELNHRVKNNLAIVQAIAQQTLRHAASLEEARVALVNRLSALGNAHDVLTRNAWEAGNLRDIVEQGVLTQASTGRIVVEGPEVALKPNLVMAISLALHELGTNALKYGSLSDEKGRVHLTWKRDGDNLALTWEESDGPIVTEPTTRGFGTKLLERVILGEGGLLDIQFAPAGLIVQISLRL